MESLVQAVTAPPCSRYRSGMPLGSHSTMRCREPQLRSPTAMDSSRRLRRLDSERNAPMWQPGAQMA